MNVEHIEVSFLFFWMEGETVWYPIDIEEDHFRKEMSQYKKQLLVMLLLWSIQRKEMKTATLTGFKLWPYGHFWESIFTGAYLPQKTDLLPCLERERNSVQTPVEKVPQKVAIILRP
jgi:hypothetical protein